MLPAGDGLITEQRLLTETEDAFPTLTMRREIAVVRHIDKGILTGVTGTCLISI